MVWYKFNCPVCSGVIVGAGDDSDIDDGNEDDRIYEVISEGDERLCRWDNIPWRLEIQISQHIMDYKTECEKEHPQLMLAASNSRAANVVLEEEEILEIGRENSSLVIGSPMQKSLSLCPVTSLHLLRRSYIASKWSPPSSKCNTPILRLKTHLIHWIGIRYRKLKSGRDRRRKTELQALMESTISEINFLLTGCTVFDGILDEKYSIDENDLGFMGGIISEIVETVFESLAPNDASTKFANIFNPDEFVRYMRNILSTAVKAILPCPMEEMKDYYESQVDQFTIMVTSHLKCIAQYEASK